MINHVYSNLFMQDNVKKDLIFDFGDFTITNDKLYAKAFDLYESLCSENELKFGSCEASCLNFQCRNEFGELLNRKFDVFIVLNGDYATPFKIGSYKVFEDKPSGDRQYKIIKAYDAIYDVINAEMVDWYNSLVFPLSLKDFRDSFFDYLGIEQVQTELVNDNMIVEKTIDADSISGKQIITAICELNGVFGHINRQGLFDYVSLQRKKEILYPSERIYPSQNIYPGMIVEHERKIFEYTPNLYMDCKYEDFDTEYIIKIQIRQEESDIGTIIGDGNNSYVVENNFLVYGKDEYELRIIAIRLYGKIHGIQYKPFQAIAKGNPCVEVGDTVLIYTKNKAVETYVLERDLKGIQSLKDNFAANGVYEYSEKVNSTNREIKRLKGKTSKLERTVEMLNSEINDEEKGLKSQIKQTAEEVITKVSKGEVVSEINQSAEEVKIKGEKISLEGTITANGAFEIAKDGSMKSKRGKLGPWNLTEKGFYFDGTGFLYVGFNDTEWLLNIPGEGAISTHNIHGDHAIFDVIQVSTKLWQVIDGSTSSLHNLSVHESFKAYGTKERVAATKSYNARSLYCYEMPSPMFGDIGHGVIGEDGLCYIDIDQIFYETIDTIQSYQVFLQSYSEHNVYVLERQPQYFVVKGKPNTEFDWEVKAKQIDFPIHRLEENFVQDEYEETDYVSLANEYLTQYEKEVLNYE